MRWLRSAAILGCCSVFPMFVLGQDKPSGKPQDVKKAGAPKDGGFSKYLKALDLRRDVVYGKAGDRALQLDLLLPKKPSSAKLPILVFIHGGGWKQGNRTHGYPVVAPIVATGNYVAGSIGYRLSGEAKWPAQVHDCKAGLRWMRAHAAEFGGDPDRIALIGPSAGGHLVALLGTSANDKQLEGENGTPGVSTAVTCVVDIFGPTDLVKLGRVVEATGNVARSSVAALFGGKVDDHLKEMQSASPINRVSAQTPPFLILHGTKDKLVPFTESTLFKEKLRAAGVPVALVTVKGAGHGPLGDAAMDVMHQFLEKQLRSQSFDIKDIEVEFEAKPTPRG